MEAKNILLILFIAIFTITAIITLLGITNIIKNIKEKYLTALFTSLILEVIGGVIVLFNSYDFSESKKIPVEFYKISSIDSSAPVEKNILLFSELIKKGEKYDEETTALSTENIALKMKLEELEQLSNNFYTQVIELENLRNYFKGFINLNFKYSDVNKQAYKVKSLNLIKDMFFTLGRLDSDQSSNDEIIHAFQAFKKENNRPLDKTAHSYTLYRQDIPLFVKEYLESNYELKYKIYSENR